jgi:hypothetical protein
MSDRFVNGARVTNPCRLFSRANLAAFMAGVPVAQRPSSHPDAVVMARAHPKKSWAKRYLRARGMRL